MNKKINKFRLYLLDLPRDIKLIISLAVDFFYVFLLYGFHFI